MLSQVGGLSGCQRKPDPVLGIFAVNPIDRLHEYTYKSLQAGRAGADRDDEVRLVYEARFVCQRPQSLCRRVSVSRPAQFATEFIFP